KTDSHADDIIQIVREEFGEGNDFCRKVTYREKDPKKILTDFRNAYNPRIAVTVDMIATGTDVKPLECLIFMRNVKSKNYFEQMKGRGTRTLTYDDLKKVTPSVTSNKTHFVIVDAVGVTKTLKTDSRPLERKKSVPLKDLMLSVMMGGGDEDTCLSLANRLGRLEKQITPEERRQFQEYAQGKTINQVVHDLLNAYDADAIESHARTQFQVQEPDQPTTEQLTTAQEALIGEVRNTFSTGEFVDYVDNVRRSHEQIIDSVNLDRL
ncbi:MAG: restriction endonuclease subunit R, partial [Gammaproteobacteria bacterium]|nr:restriction endonuclease subunit R [Gammaproteobacteria bacterium]